MEHKEIKLTDIFRECMQKKIVLTIVLVGSLLFGGLFFGLVFNRVNEQYSMNFSLSFEGINNGQYPNGKDFLLFQSQHCLLKQQEKTFVLYGVHDLLVVETEDIVLT